MSNNYFRLFLERPFVSGCLFWRKKVYFCIPLKRLYTISSTKTIEALVEV